MADAKAAPPQQWSLFPPIHHAEPEPPREIPADGNLPRGALPYIRGGDVNGNDAPVEGIENVLATILDLRRRRRR